MQHERHRVPVTALSLWNHEFLLSGQGTTLNAYHASSRTLLCSLAIFKDQQIHGIVTGVQDEVAFALIWGGQYVCKVGIEQIASRSVTFHPGRIYQTGDWVLDVDLAPISAGHELRVAVLTAHNALAIWDLNDGREEELLDPLVPGSNCILYSAHVQWLSVSKCLVAAGTAFGDVIIWSCLLSFEDGGRQAQPQTHFTFSAHEGSVFGVHISSDEVAAAVDGRKHLLASCSDDRTIKLWDISDLSLQSPTLKDLQRDTGFGAKQIIDNYAPPCLGKVMAHASRIWHVRLTASQENQGQGPDKVRLWSFGEDASYIVWRLESSDNAGSAAQYLLRQCQTRKPHGGKNIWALAVAGPHDVFTGGADGAIVRSVLAEVSSRQGSPLEIDSSAANNNGLSERFKAYVFTGVNELVATTDQGRILLLKLRAGEEYSISEVSPPINGLHGYSLLSGCPGIVFAAGVDGAVHACLPAGSHITEIIQTDSKVTGLFSKIIDDGSDVACNIALLATNINSVHATLAILALDPRDTGPGRLSLIKTYKLHLVDVFVVTSFAVWRSGNHTYVILGSRHGTISFFDIAGDQNQPIPIKASFSGVHCDEAITSLHFVTQSNMDQSFGTLFSTGRDGTYAAHSLRIEDDLVQLEGVHQLSLPFGPNIEGLGYSPTGDLWTWGFRSTSFVAYNVRTQQEVFTAECGGAHRNWGFQVGDDDGTFVWTKASRLYCAWKDEVSTIMVTPNGHGRDIKTVSVSPTSPYIIATGSEDTNIQLSIYNAGGFSGLHTIQMHKTGIQHLQWSGDGVHLFSSGGSEEFLVWRITPGVPDVRVGVFCESTLPNSGNSDLRIMTFHAKSNRSNPQAFCISMLYSDSSVKHWQYESHTKSWLLLASGDYLTYCPTRCLQFETRLGFLTASTDGHLTTWNPPSELQMTWKSRQPVHQNAVLSLTDHVLTDRSILVFSGGDDNALAMTRYVDGLAGPGTVLMVPRAHAAAITGLVVFPDTQRKDGLWLVSASIDQRLKLWWVVVDVRQSGVQGLMIQRRATFFTSVADVSGLERIPLREGKSEGVLIVGVGMDVWRVECLE